MFSKTPVCAKKQILPIIQYLSPSMYFRTCAAVCAWAYPGLECSGPYRDVPSIVGLLSLFCFSVGGLGRLIFVAVKKTKYLNVEHYYLNSIN